MSARKAPRDFSGAFGPQQRDAVGGARGLLARIRARLANLPLGVTFATYALCYLVLATVVARWCVSALQAVYDDSFAVQLAHEAEPVNVNRLYHGPYLFEQGELVPAAALNLPGDEARAVFVAYDASGTAQLPAWMDEGGTPSDEAVAPASHAVYYTLDDVRAGTAVALDWGMNETGAAQAGMRMGDEQGLAADALAGYDEQQRAVRYDATELLFGAPVADSASASAETAAAPEASGAQAGAADGAGGAAAVRAPVSNVAYYLYSPTPSSESALAAAAYYLRGLAPFAVYGVLGIVLFRRFYRRAIAEPLRVLGAAAARIERQDLDFSIPRVRGWELGRLSAAMEAMRSALAASQRKLWRVAEERRQLNAAFAHDLRTPITVLAGTVELARLRAERDGAVSAEDWQALEAGTARLEAYATAMTGVAKLDDRVLAPRSLTAAEVAGALSSYVRALAPSPSAGTTLACTMRDAGEAAVGKTVYELDLPLIEEVLGNLVGNALRFARAAVRVEVVLEATAIAVEVRDDGPGFSPEALQRAGEAFFCEERDAVHFGLGLHIARQLACLHGGELVVANDAAGGACATARFRSSEKDAATPHEQETGRTSA